MFTAINALRALNLLPSSDQTSFPRTIALEYDARSSTKHLFAFTVVLLICATLSSFTLPYVQSFDEVVREQHVAYGYFYFPIVAAPIIASWSQEPWQTLPPSKRRSYLNTSWRICLTLLTCLSATLLGYAIEGAQTAQLCAENALWCSALIFLFLPIGFEWACILPMIYGTVGLFSPSWPGLIVNRDTNTSELITGLILTLLLCCTPLLSERTTRTKNK